MPDEQSKPIAEDTRGAPARRLFVAIALPENVKGALAGMQAELRAALPPHSVRWVARRQLHLTLVFLGEVPLARTAALADVLLSTCATLPALELSAARLGCFAQHGVPRVIWVGITDRHGALAQVQASLARATREFTRSLAAEIFTPHVTLGRCARSAPSIAHTLPALVSRAAVREFGQWQAGTVDLVHSRLAAQGTRYHRLRHFALGGA